MLNNRKSNLCNLVLPYILICRGCCAELQCKSIAEGIFSTRYMSLKPALYIKGIVSPVRLHITLQKLLHILHGNNKTRPGGC